VRKRTIVICDDEGSRASKWQELILSVGKPMANYRIVTLTKKDFDDAIQELRQRQLAARGKGAPQISETPFDLADLLVVDFDLLKFETPGSDTGEGVAYLARSYSKCGYILELNQFGTNWFDLTLSGHAESFADLNIGSDQLANPGLWSQKFDGFRPWSWPLIPQALTDLSTRVASLKGQLDKVITDFLGLTLDKVGVLPRSSREFLGVGRDPDQATFREFVTSSPFGLRRADKPLDDGQIARIAASRIAKWLEHVVLSGQETLVDAPHLVSRYPSLLTGGLSQSTLKKTGTLGQDFRKLGLRYGLIEDARFTRLGWLSRPAWRWFQIKSLESLPEDKDPWSAPDIRYEFCEDVSQFLPREGVRSFVASVDSSFDHRFLANPRADGGRKLADRNRKPGKRVPTDLTRVDYLPADRLAI